MPGGGGGGGGALGAPPGGMGGGGGALAPGIGGGGGAADGVAGLSGAGDLGLSSIADIGRGGPIVPNRIEARCFALPRSGRSASSSSDEESALESTTDHSSSSWRTRLRLPVGVDVRGGGSGCDLGAADSCCARRWKGLVDSAWGGDVMDGAAC